MKPATLAICCAAVMALAFGPACAQTLRFASSPFGERPPPPTEPSVVVPVKPAEAAPRVVAPKPVVHTIVRHRPQRPMGPITMPTQDVLVMMVRAALAGVNQANFTENYSVLRGMTTPALQARASASQLGRAFADLRKRNLDLSPVLVLTPRFTAAPLLTPDHVLKLAGNFPSRPVQINFAIDYRPVDGFWLIDSLSVSTTDTSAPVVAAQPAQALPTADARPVLTASARPMQSAIPVGRFAPIGSRFEVQPRLTFVSQSAAPAYQGQADRNAPAVLRGAYVQVSSQRSEAEAQAAFRALQAQFPRLLGNRQAVIRRADLGAKGIYYRAQIGPFSPAQAEQQCSDLKVVGGQCFLQYN